MLNQTLALRDDVVIAGITAFQRRQAEVARPPSGPKTLSAASLERLADRVEELLGSNFAKLQAAHKRGLGHPSTPPKKVHRLIELAAIARNDAATFATDAPGVHAQEVAELDAAVALLDRWKNDPTMPEILASLKDANSFAHVLVTLTTASYLVDVGNAVELVPSGESERTPDLRIHIGAQRRVNAEVKVPSALVRPASAVNRDEATPIVRKAAEKAGTGSAGQLSPEHPGLLIVGALNLREPDVAELVSAAETVANERPAERTHLMGIAISTVGSLLGGVSAGPHGLRLQKQLSISAASQTRIALNRNYEGETGISTETSPDTTIPEIESTDVSLEAIRAAQEGRKVGRNDPCWCGSGRKFKKCHGA